MAEGLITINESTNLGARKNRLAALDGIYHGLRRAAMD